MGLGGPIPGCFSFMGLWVPSSLAVVQFFTSIWRVFHQTFHSPRFMVSARACLPRSFASSRLTAIFLVVVVHVVLRSCCSVRDFSSGLFLHLHLVVVHSDVVCGWSLQRYSIVLCCDVVARPAPLRKLTTTRSADMEETFWETPTAWCNTTV